MACSLGGQGHQDIDFVPAPVVLNDRAGAVAMPGSLQPFHGGSNALIESGRLAAQPDPKVPPTGDGTFGKPELGGLIIFTLLHRRDSRVLVPPRCRRSGGPADRRRFFPAAPTRW